LQIFTKIRLADLVEPKPKEENPMWIQCFNKIKAKHIDFALADEDTNIIVLIELDDRTHQRPDREERDVFVNAVLKNTGYTLLRTYGSTDEIEEHLK
jgi:very-short-patch-repair endonuclease